MYRFIIKLRNVTLTFSFGNIILSIGYSNQYLIHKISEY